VHWGQKTTEEPKLESLCSNDSITQSNIMPEACGPHPEHPQEGVPWLSRFITGTSPGTSTLWGKPKKPYLQKRRRKEISPSSEKQSVRQKTHKRKHWISPQNSELEKACLASKDSKGFQE
jgi:hypothetical protein